MALTTQVQKGFQNENTVWNLRQANRLDEFHKKYDDALAKARKGLGKTYDLVIGGQRVKSTGGTFDDTNPTNTKELVAKFPLATKTDVERAIKAAQDAYPAWSRLGFEERCAIVRKAHDLFK